MSVTHELEAQGKTTVPEALSSAGLSLLLIVGFTLLTTLGAQLRIPLPFTPVPVTLQTLMVLLAGAMLGGTRGALSQLLYAAWGVAGVPLFAYGAAGLAVLAGPTGGYIIGFVIAAALVGRLIQGADTLFAQAAVFTVGTLAILFAGWLHLTLIYTGGDMGRAFLLGVLPFLPGAALKVIAATAIWQAWTVVRRGR
jgi:biotin transport system substrate-specific component